MKQVRARNRVLVLLGLVVLAGLAAVFGQPSTERRPVRVATDVEQPQLGAVALPAPDADARARATPTASPLGSVSTTWFCGGGTSADSGDLATHLVLVNRSPRVVSTSIRIMSSDGKRATRQVEIPGRSAQTESLADVGSDGVVAAVVEARGGGLTVSQRLGTGDDVAVSACATTSSETWFFSGGDTQKGATEQLVLFNPFDDIVTADVSFLTADGYRHPQATQGLPVSPRSVLVVDVADVQNRRSDLASMVSTRAGRLVVWRTQRFDGTGPSLPAAFSPKGTSVALGLSSALTHFALPTAVTGEGVVARVILSNPGTVDATVRLGFAPDDPAGNGQPPDSTVKVPAGAVAVLGPEQLRQVPAGVPFTVTGAVTRGGPVVAELWLDGAEPAKGHGASAAPAIPVSARRWIAPNGLRSPSLDQLGIQATSQAATFTISYVDGGKTTRLREKDLPRRVGKGGRVSVDLMSVLGAHPGATVIVEATAPVVVSRLQAGAEARGLVSYAALPIAGALGLP